MLRPFLLLLVTVLIGKSEVISGSKILPGGSDALIGIISIDGNQSFGPVSAPFRAVVFPGFHTVNSNAPAGYLVSYSICVNCIGHPTLSYIVGNSVTVALPINGSVDVSWLYTPRSGTVQGARILPNGTAFTNASITIDSLQTVPGGTSSFSSVIPIGSHTVSSSIPTGYAVSYSLCSNCTQHLPASFLSGAVAAVDVPANGYVDVAFQYTLSGSTQITVGSPAPNQTITGSLNLSVSGGSLAQAASVEYAIGSNRIARVPAQSSNPAFQTTWNSALASDCASQIEITARDYLDNIVFQDIRPIVLSNFGNAATAPLAGQLAGAAPLTLTAFDRLHFPAYWQVFLDGEIAPGSTGLLFSDHDAVHSNARNTVLDTTIYPNGRHEFHFAFHSNDYPVTNSNAVDLDFRGMATQNVNIDNGRALMEILPNYLFVYTPTSTGVQLTCGRAYTNGDRDPCLAPAYTVDSATSSPGIQVSGSGLVKSFQEGYGDIIVSEAGKTATVHVWVRNTPGLPHFQDAGRYGSTYLAGRSLFVVAPFQLSPDMLMADPALVASAKRAGVNTLNKGIYLPNSNLALAFATWKQSFDSGSYASAWNWSAANGFRVLGAGDDIARRPGWEASWIANWPAAPQALQYAMQTFAQSGAGLSLDVVDESSALWGSNPTPVGLIGGAHAPQSASCTGSQCLFSWPSLLDSLDYTYHDILMNNRSFVLAGTSALTTPPGGASSITAISPGQITFSVPAAFSTSRNFDPVSSPDLEFLWFSGAVNCPGNLVCNPRLPNQVLSNVASWLRSASSTVAISWPPAGAALPYVHRNWMKSGGVSDYASHYWDSNQQRRTYVFGMGARENQNSMLTAFLARQSSVNFNRPQLLQQSMAGIDYLKNSPAGVASYSPPVDQLLHVGQVPRAVVSGIMTAAAAGSAGVKLYKFDTSYTARRDNIGNGSEFESDAGPDTGETLNWQAMGYASAILAKSLPDYILGQPLNSPYLGRNLITAARQGTNGNLLMVVNGWDGVRTVPVDLSSYRTGFSVLRYRVADTSIKLQPLGDVAADTALLGPGETVLYVLPRTSGANGIDSVTFQPDTAGTKTVLRTNYLYSQNTAAFGDPVDCSAGCTVKVDRKLGEAFYSYAVLDGTGAALCRSAAILVPAGTSVGLPVAAQTRGAFCQ